MENIEEFEKAHQTLEDKIKKIQGEVDEDVLYSMQLNLFQKWEEDNEEEEDLIKFFEWANTLSDSEIKTISVLAVLGKE
jgi:hypothetical protein